MSKLNYSSRSNQWCNRHVNMLKHIDLAELQRSVGMIKWHFLVILVILIFEALPNLYALTYWHADCTTVLYMSGKWNVSDFQLPKFHPTAKIRRSETKEFWEDEGVKSVLINSFVFLWLLWTNSSSALQICSEMDDQKKKNMKVCTVQIQFLVWHCWRRGAQDLLQSLLKQHSECCNFFFADIG